MKRIRSIISAIVISFPSYSANEKIDFVFYDVLSNAPYYSAVDIAGVGLLSYSSKPDKKHDDSPNKNLLDISGEISGELFPINHSRQLTGTVISLCSRLKNSSSEKLKDLASSLKTNNEKIDAAIKNIFSREDRGYSLEESCLLDFSEFHRYIYGLNITCQTRFLNGKHSEAECKKRFGGHDSRLAYVFAHAALISALNADIEKERKIINLEKIKVCDKNLKERHQTINEKSEEVRIILTRKGDPNENLAMLNELKNLLSSLPKPINCINTGIPEIEEKIADEENYLAEIFKKISIEENNIYKQIEKIKLDKALKSCSENKDQLYEEDLERLSRARVRIETLESLKSINKSNIEIAQSAVKEAKSFLQQLKLPTYSKDCLSIDEFKSKYIDILEKKSEISSKISTFESIFNTINIPEVTTSNQRSNHRAAPSTEEEEVLTDRMATYTTVIGRAMGCRFDVTRQISELGDWIDNTFSYDPEMRRVFGNISADGLVYHANLQSSGRTPTTCSEVRGLLNSLRIR